MKCKKCGGEPYVWHYSWLGKWYADCQEGKCQRHESETESGAVGLWNVANAKPRRRAKPFRRWTWDRDNEAKLGPDRIDYDGKLFVRIEQGGVEQTQNIIALVKALNRARVVMPKK